MYQKLRFSTNYFVNYNVLDNKLELYFPMMVQQLGWLLLLFGILTFSGLVPIPNKLLTAAGTLIGIVLTFAYKGAKLDLEQKRIKVYFGILGLKVGTWRPLPEELLEIVYTSGTYSQQMHAWVSRNEHSSRIYRGFLKGSKGYKQLFTSGGNPDSVLQEVQQAAKSLNLPATNYNIRPPAKIN